jgi:glutaminase
MTIDELIVNKLDTLEKKIGNVDEQLTLCRVDIAGLKVKSGIWGAIAGLVPAGVAATMWILSVQ